MNSFLGHKACLFVSIKMWFLKMVSQSMGITKSMSVCFQRILAQQDGFLEHVDFGLCCFCGHKACLFVSKEHVAHQDGYPEHVDT